ncbi:hypothetical protein J6590_057402 [Homalodisca vitripennis]|nr:hypothetical protein J6590_057402 [Homalodisca vitripennis]
MCILEAGLVALLSPSVTPQKGFNLPKCKQPTLIVCVRKNVLIISDVQLDNIFLISLPPHPSIVHNPNGMQPPINVIKIENPGYYCSSYTPPAPDHSTMMASGAYRPRPRRVGVPVFTARLSPTVVVVPDSVGGQFTDERKISESNFTPCSHRLTAVAHRSPVAYVLTKSRKNARR